LPTFFYCGPFFIKRGEGEYFNPEGVEAKPPEGGFKNLGKKHLKRPAHKKKVVNKEWTHECGGKFLF